MTEGWEAEDVASAAALALEATAAEEEAAAEESAALSLLFPCRYRGTFTAIAPWSVAYGSGTTPPIALAGPRLDIPLALEGVKSMGQVEAALLPQFRSLCASNFPGPDHPSFFANREKSNDAGSRDSSGLGGGEKRNAEDESAESKAAAAEAGVAAVRTGWDPASCSEDLLRQVKEWLVARCSEERVMNQETASQILSHHTNAAAAGVEESLGSFRRFVQTELGLGQEWTLADVDDKFFKSGDDDDGGLDPGNGAVKGGDNSNSTGNEWPHHTHHLGIPNELSDEETGDDHCSVVWSSMLTRQRLKSQRRGLGDRGVGSGSASSHGDNKAGSWWQEEEGEVLIVGDLVGNPFVKRQRDFVLRDLLGCLPRARVCVEARGEGGDSEDEEVVEKECKEMLQYAIVKQRYREAWWRRNDARRNGGSCTNDSVNNSNHHDENSSESSSEHHSFGWSCGSCRRQLESRQRSFLAASSLTATSQLSSPMDTTPSKKKHGIHQPPLVFVSAHSLLSSSPSNDGDDVVDDDKDNGNVFVLKDDDDDVAKALAWRPEVIIHLNDEAATPPATLARLYNHGKAPYQQQQHQQRRAERLNDDNGGDGSDESDGGNNGGGNNGGNSCSRLVLRMYRHPESEEESKTRKKSSQQCRVVTIPVGYLGGFTSGDDESVNDGEEEDEEGGDCISGSGSGDKNTAAAAAAMRTSKLASRSGLEAIKANNLVMASAANSHRLQSGNKGYQGTMRAMTTQRQKRKQKLRKHFWSFVGTRCMHHPHTTDSRTAMTNFFSALPNHEQQQQHQHQQHRQRQQQHQQRQRQQQQYNEDIEDSDSLDHVCHLTDRDG
jgi:hypothetical protein